MEPISKGSAPRSILVALDASPRAERVLHDAALLASANGARLWLLHVVMVPPTLPGSVWPLPTQELAEHLMSAARERMTELPKDTIAGTMIRVGSPWREICAVAAETDAELIVIGAHGYGAIDRFLGTTAANVVNHADRSVFVVRERESAAA